MNKNSGEKLLQPFENKLVFRVMVVLIVILALLAGYYYTLYSNQAQQIEMEVR